MRKIKIWGERCSGTSYLRALFRDNLVNPSFGLPLVWKHGFAPVRDARKDLLNVFVVRDPFVWIQSFYARPWHAPRQARGESISSFIRREWVSDIHDRGWTGIERIDDRHPVTKRRFRNVLEMRSVKLRYNLVALGLVPNGCLVRYEDAANAPQAVLKEIAEAFDLELKAGFRPVHRYKGHGRTYVEKEYDPIPEGDVKYISDNLDEELETPLGYATGAFRHSNVA